MKKKKGKKIHVEESEAREEKKKRSKIGNELSCCYVIISKLSFTILVIIVVR